MEPLCFLIKLSAGKSNPLEENVHTTNGSKVPSPSLPSHMGSPSILYSEAGICKMPCWRKLWAHVHLTQNGYHYVLNISYIVSHSLGWGVILITWSPLPVWLRWTHCFYDYMISYVLECWKISSGKPLATQTASRLVMLDWAISLYYTTTHSKPLLLVTFKWSHANNCVFPTLV